VFVFIRREALPLINVLQTIVAVEEKTKLCELFFNLIYKADMHAMAGGSGCLS